VIVILAKIMLKLAHSVKMRILHRHHYEGLVSYPANVVVDRAKSLCPHHVSPDKSKVVRMYWPFFRDDEHFANWCQTGFCFTDCMKAAVVKNYATTALYDLATLREGIGLSVDRMIYSILHCLTFSVCLLFYRTRNNKISDIRISFIIHR